MAAGGGKAQQHSPEGVEAMVIRYFTEKGLTPAQAAGIAGNLRQESSYNPSASGGYLAQWLGARLAGLEAFAHSKGHASAAGRPEVQLEYIWQELNTSERGALEQLRRTKTPQEAARVFSNSYERPSAPNLPAREKYAAEAAKRAKPGSWGGPIGEAFGAITAAPEAALEGVEAVGEGVQGIGDLIGILTDPDTYLRFAEGVGGMVLLAMGLKTLTRGSGGGAVAEAGRQARAGHHLVRKAAEAAVVL